MSIEFVSELEGLTAQDLDELLEEGFFEDFSKEENIEMVGDFIVDYYDMDLDHPDLPDNIWERLSPFMTKDEVQYYIHQNVITA